MFLFWKMLCRCVVWIDQRLGTKCRPWLAVHSPTSPCMMELKGVCTVLNFHGYNSISLDAGLVNPWRSHHRALAATFDKLSSDAFFFRCLFVWALWLLVSGCRCWCVVLWWGIKSRTFRCWANQFLQNGHQVRVPLFLPLFMLLFLAFLGLVERLSGTTTWNLLWMCCFSIEPPSAPSALSPSSRGMVVNTLLATAP